MNGLYLTLPIFLPLVGGLVSYLIRFPSTRSRHLFYGVLICLTSAVTWLSILRCGSESFQLLRFTEELTLTLRMDGASRLFAGLAATLWPFTMLYAFDYMSHEKHLSMFWSFFTVSFGVTLGVAFAGNMMTMYLFYELLTLATLPLVMQPMSTTARKAGVKYAVYSMSGAALAFIGLVFLVVNDAQDFTLGGHLAGYTGDRQLLLAVFVLAFVGFGVKAAIWPLHAWLPAAAVAPTPVTALLHAVAVVKSGAFACIRLIYYAFGTEILVGTWAQQAVMTLTLITILFASCMSVKQRHFKRRLAYSTVSNLAFFTAGAVLHYSHREYVHQLEGLGKRMPVTFVCYTVAACALTGVPPFTGFVSKWYIALAAVDTYQPLPIIGFGVLLVSALLTAIYMFQIAVRAWFPRHSAPAIPEGSVHEAGWQMLVPMVVLAAACLLMGLMPQGLLDLIREAVTL